MNEYWFEKILQKLELKFGRYAIPRLPLLIVGLNILLYLLSYTNPESINLFTLNSNKILQGQIWRLVTYLFIPPTYNPFLLFMVLYFIYFVGSALEHEWGVFRLNVYYFVGMIATTIVAFFLPSIQLTNGFFNTSLLFAFAVLFPEFPVYIFFIIPVRVKYLAGISGIFVVLSLLFGDWPLRLVVMASFLNFFLFFFPYFFQIAKRRRESFITAASVTESEPFHKCASCGKTELEDSQLEFRVCAVCKKEFCMVHLKAHQCSIV